MQQACHQLLENIHQYIQVAKEKSHVEALGETTLKSMALHQPHHEYALATLQAELGQLQQRTKAMQDAIQGLLD